MDIRKLDKRINVRLEALQNSKDIILLANVREPRGYKNPVQLHSDSAEYFSVEEFNEIYKGIINAGFFIRKVFFNEIDFLDDIVNQLSDYKSSIVYNLFQNGRGSSKKTLVPAICDMLSISYITSGGFELSLCRNKYFCSKLLPSKVIPRSWCYLGNSKWYNDETPEENLKIIIKPNNTSSSVGISNRNVFEYSNNCLDLIEHLYEDNRRNYLIAQEFITGFECEVPIISYGKDVISFPPVGLKIKGQQKGDNILTYQISTQNDYSFYDLSEILDIRTIEHIESITQIAFQRLNLKNYARIDFRITSNGKPYITDINATPYTTKHSSFAFQLQKLGLPYENIFKYIIYNAVNPR